MPSQYGHELPTMQQISDTAKRMMHSASRPNASGIIHAMVHNGPRALPLEVSYVAAGAMIHHLTGSRNS